MVASLNRHQVGQGEVAIDVVADLDVMAECDQLKANGCPKVAGHLFDCPECHEDAFILIIMGATWVARIMIINLDPGIDGLKSSRYCSCC